jgi:hypothetical protein
VTVPRCPVTDQARRTCSLLKWTMTGYRRACHQCSLAGLVDAMLQSEVEKRPLPAELLASRSSGIFTAATPPALSVCEWGHLGSWPDSVWGESRSALPGVSMTGQGQSAWVGVHPPQSLHWAASAPVLAGALWSWICCQSHKHACCGDSQCGPSLQIFPSLYLQI